MNETSKTKAIWTEFEWSILRGEGIDIGCGGDIVTPGARAFDMQHGDANRITQHVTQQFDFVFSSHCLEHMHDPAMTLQDWWKLVKPGGHLFVIVPDEDLYEQGVFPSRFNPDHKATFTICKRQSWSPRSLNLLELARALPNAKLVRIEVQDLNYDRSLLKHGPRYSAQPYWARFLARAFNSLQRRSGIQVRWMAEFTERRFPVDQTLRRNTLAQIQCIVQKVGGN